MHAVFSLGALLTMVSSAVLSSAAAGCDLKPVDLTDLLRVQVGAELVATTSLVDPDSAEPILRHIVSLSDGSLMVLDQRDCLIRNISLSVLHRQPDLSMISRRALADILALTPLWQEGFAGQDPAQLLNAEVDSARFRALVASGQPGSYAADDQFDASGAASEALISIVPLEGGPFRAFLSLDLSLGGE